MTAPFCLEDLLTVVISVCANVIFVAEVICLEALDLGKALQLSGANCRVSLSPRVRSGTGEEEQVKMVLRLFLKKSDFIGRE